jgi:hypothetical protein
VKLLLDEMLSPSVAKQLRARGHDVEAVCGSEHEELDDPAVLDVARAQRRAVVTNNVQDFRPLHVAAVEPGGAGHYGMIFMPGGFGRAKADIGRIVTALEAILQAHPGAEALKDAEAWL